MSRNIDANYHLGRRAAHSRALPARYGNDPTFLYTDATSYTGRAGDVVQCIKSYYYHNLNRYPPGKAIVLATNSHPEESVTYLTDPPTACPNYLSGCISLSALLILKNCSATPDIRIVWAPGHVAISGNEVVQAAARDFIHRALAHGGQLLPPKINPIHRMATHILAHYRLIP